MEEMGEEKEMGVGEFRRKEGKMDVNREKMCDEKESVRKTTQDESLKCKWSMTE